MNFNYTIIGKEPMTLEGEWEFFRDNAGWSATVIEETFKCGMVSAITNVLNEVEKPDAKEWDRDDVVRMIKYKLGELAKMAGLEIVVNRPA